MRLPYESVKIFIPKLNELFVFEEGTGDNLLVEDRAEGYVDYFMYSRYPLEYVDSGGEPIEEFDGGMHMTKTIIREEYTDLIEAIPDLLGEIFMQGADMEYIILWDED